MTPLAWALIGLTVAVTAALVFAVLTWRRVGGYMKECRGAVQCYRGLAERAKQCELVHGEPETELAASEPMHVEDVGAAKDIEEKHPTGRHALPEIPNPLEDTSVLPAVDELADEPPDALATPTALLSAGGELDGDATAIVRPYLAERPHDGTPPRYLVASGGDVW